MTRLTRPQQVALGLAVLGGLCWAASRPYCLSASLLRGVEARSCPDGAFRQVPFASVEQAVRGHSATLIVGARAHYAVEGSERDQVGLVRRFSAKASLVDAAGKEIPLERVGDWRTVGESRVGQVKFPAVPDGDYRVHVALQSPLGTDTVDVPLALYAPAKIHVITDRPLYQPGDLIKFRAVALRARDLTPLDGRPGHWEVHDPSGELLLEERAPAGAWGVVGGTFPLDRGAPPGSYRVAWVSGDARDEVSVRVEPFVLPRFRIETAASAPFYLPHQKPRLTGRVVYSSGAPVAKARLDITWSVGGSWPPPRSWQEHALPQEAVADASGAFTLSLPEIPADLQGQAPLTAHLTATDASGDRVEGAATVLLSEDAIAASAVTELADGLVEGFNNRLFLRATTASGTVLHGVELTVQRAWDPGDEGVKTLTDEDGVAQLQLDPGPAVNIVIPPLPYRPPPPEPLVSLQGTDDLLGGSEGVPLADQRALERIVPAVGPCARFAEEEGDAQLGLEVDASGAIRAVGQDASPLAACAARQLAGARLPPGKPRLYRTTLGFSSRAMPAINVAVDGVPGQVDAVRAAITTAALDARACLPRNLGGQGALLSRATWHVASGQKRIELSWSKLAGDSSAATTCLQARAAGLTLPETSKQSMVGVAAVTINPSAQEQQSAPQATTMLGYELEVTARADGRELGHTTLRIKPGTVPALRLRAEPVLAQAGAPLEVEVLRGPSYGGELPAEVFLSGDTCAETLKATLDPDTRKARFTVPPGASGWLRVQAANAQALVFVRSQQELTVALQTDKPRYAPGQKAHLSISTKVGGQGAQAALGLFGVDESLGQLVALPGPDALARLHDKVPMSAPAFGTLDGEALTLGRIRGANAAMATVLRVTGVPPREALDGVFRGSQAAAFDPGSELTDRFYEVLGELHDQARAWEEQADKKEKIHPPQMARLWKQALAAVQARGGRIDDAYGRPLRLSTLPHDLLALTDPMNVIVDGTRRPEDIENWAAYVAREKP